MEETYKIGNILLSKKLIELDTQKTQINNYLLGKADKPASLEEIFKIGHTLLTHRKEKKYKPIINFLQETFNEKLIQTSSGGLYKPDGSGIVIHNKGLNIEQRIPIDNMVGPDRCPTKKDEPLIRAFTGYSLKLAREISKILTDMDNISLLRLNKNLDQDYRIYRVARFDADSDLAYLNCYRGPDSSLPALGVKIGGKAISYTKKFWATLF